MKCVLLSTRHIICKTKLYVNAIINVSSAKKKRVVPEQNDKKYTQITVAWNPHVYYYFDCSKVFGNATIIKQNTII
jgi:hypothetical protein